MKHDVKSHYILAVAAAAISHTAGAVEGTAVDHSVAGSASFLINVGTFGASATLDAKLQHSDDGLTWTDDDGETGNTTSITQMTEAGSAQLDVITPQALYSRVLVTTATEAVVYGVTSVLGPKYTIYPE